MQKDFQAINCSFASRGICCGGRQHLPEVLLQLESGTEEGGMTWRFESSAPACPVPSDFHTIQLNDKH